MSADLQHLHIPHHGAPPPRARPPLPPPLTLIAGKRMEQGEAAWLSLRGGILVPSSNISTSPTTVCLHALTLIG